MTDSVVEQPPSYEASHRALSEEDWRFRQLAREDAAWLRRSSFQVFDNPTELLMFRIQPWPTFLSRERVAEIARVSVGICKLIKSLPHRIFRGDASALSRFYGLGSPREAQTLLDPPTGIDGAIGRGDFIQTDEALQCLEFNMVANLGGWETKLLAELHLKHPLTTRWLDRLGTPVTYTDTTLRLFEHVVREVCRARGGSTGTVNIAMVVGEGGSLAMKRSFGEMMSGVYRECQEGDGSVGGRFLICRYRDLIPRGRDVYYRNTRIDALVDVFAGPIPPSVLRAFKAGRLEMFNSPLSSALSDKRSLALLSQNAASGPFSEQERSLLENHLPWTRLVEAEHTEYRAETVYLPELLASQREELVLKQSKLGGGKGVHLGRLTDEASWAELARRALQEPEWIVQQHVGSVPYLFQGGEEGCSPHDVIWSPFVFGHEYAGCILRMQPVADDTIVNLSLTATEGLIFELTDSAPDVF